MSETKKRPCPHRRVTIATMNGSVIERYVITGFQAIAIKRILDTMTEKVRTDG